MGFTAIFMVIKKIVASFITIFLLIGVSGTSVHHDVKDPDNCNLNFTVMSDSHMEGNNKESRDNFIKLMYDVKNNDSGNDAIIFTGDNTMNGQDIENMFFYGLLESINPTDKMFTAMGNHDTGNGINDYSTRSARFWDYYNTYNNANVTKPYYYSIVNDCYFIFMGSEKDNINETYISDEQMEWLDATLSDATKDGKPAFVFNHHPYYCALDKSQPIYDTVKKYSNVFYISGHMHAHDYSIQNMDDDSYYINLPRCTDTGAVGNGIQVEVYDSYVLVRTRDYFKSEWVADYTFELNKS